MDWILCTQGPEISGNVLREPATGPSCRWWGQLLGLGLESFSAPLGSLRHWAQHYPSPKKVGCPDQLPLLASAVTTTPSHACVCSVVTMSWGAMWTHTRVRKGVDKEGTRPLCQHHTHLGVLPGTQDRGTRLFIY